jgi:hypothetical protein
MPSRSRNARGVERITLAVENLEDRSLPSGDVSAYVSGGVLSVSSTDPGAAIWINSIGSGTVQLVPVAGSTVDGQGGILTMSGISNGYSINLSGDSSYVDITGLRDNVGVFANLSGTASGLNLAGCSYTGVTSLQFGGLGNHVISMGDDDLGGSTLLTMNGGNNRLYFSSVQFGAVSMVSGGGSQPSYINQEGVNYTQNPLMIGFQPPVAAFMPIAHDTSATVNQGQSVSINLAASVQPIQGSLNVGSIKIVHQPANGSVAIAGNGIVTYTSSGTQSGLDSFTYTMQNSSGTTSNVGTVYIHVISSGPPSTTISSTASSPTNLASIPVTVKFSEPVTGFTSADLTVTNGTISGFTGSGSTYTFDIAPTADGAITVNVAAGVAKNSAGQGNLAATQFSITSDRTAPTASITSTATSPTNLASIPVKVTFSTSVTGFSSTSVSVTNGTISGFSGSGTTYTFNVAPTADGTVTVSVAAGVANDAAGNANTAATPFTITSTRSALTVGVTTTATSPTNASSIPVTVTFNRSVSNFTSSGVNVTNGTITGFAGSGTTYTFNVAPTADGTVTVTVTAGAATDSAGNSNTAAPTPVSVISDRTNPTVTVNTTVAGQFTGTASDATSGIANVKISIFDGTSTKYWDGTGFNSASEVFLTPTTSNNFANWSYVFSTPGTYTVHAVATDKAGNTASSSQSVTLTASPIPTLATTATSPTNATSIPFTVTFSESVTGFTSSGVNVTNGSVTNFTGTGASYSFDVTPTADGTVTVQVPANAATDGSSNPNPASNTISIVSQTTPPAPTISSTASNPTNLTSIPITVTFTESVTGFTSSDVSVTNGTISGFSGSGTTYTFNVAPTASGTVTVDVPAGVATDAAGNPNTAATQFSITAQPTPPTATLATTVTSPTNDNPIAYTVNFSESVTGFTSSGVTVTNGTVSNFQGSGASYSFNVIPTANGNVVVKVPAGVAMDAAGNHNTASSTSTILYQGTFPTVVINAATTGQISGTVTNDAAGIASMQLSIYNGKDYWTGTGFTSATQVFVTPTTSNNYANWTYAFATKGTYTVFAKATDNANNFGTATSSVRVS